MTAGPTPVNSMRLHIAFDVAFEDLLAAPARLRAQGVIPLSFFRHGDL